MTNCVGLFLETTLKTRNPIGDIKKANFRFLHFKYFHVFAVRTIAANRQYLFSYIMTQSRSYRRYSNKNNRRDATALPVTNYRHVMQ